MILGTLGTLSRRGGALDPAERHEFVDMAVRQGTRLKEPIEQLLLAAWFEQATRRAGGVGLGLYIARQLSQTQGEELLVTDTTPPGLGALPEAAPPAGGAEPRPVLAYAASRR